MERSLGLATSSPFDASVVWQTLSEMWTSALARVPYLVAGIAVVIAFAVAARVANGVIRAASARTRIDTTLADLLGRVVSFGVNTLGLFVAAVVVFPSFHPGDLVAGLGLTSVAVGFAFKDVLQNFFAGILILWRRPFVVGDQIRVLDFEGTVEEITIRSTRLRTYDGERAVLPNGDVYTSAILVRTAYDRRRVRFAVGVGYPDSVEAARETILAALAGAEGVLGDPTPQAFVTQLAPSSVNFTAFFWTGSEQSNVLAVGDRVATAIKLALDAAGIDMPFPHTVVLFQDATGAREGDADRDRCLDATGNGGRAPAGDH